MECCDRTLEIDPEYAYAWHGKGTSLYSLGKYYEAIGCYDKALEIEPSNAVASEGRENAYEYIRRI